MLPFRNYMCVAFILFSLVVMINIQNVYFCYCVSSCGNKYEFKTTQNFAVQFCLLLL